MGIERPVRRLRMENALNMRDLGGFETDSGKVTSFGKLLRSGDLSKLTGREWERLYYYGVRTVVDLRSQAEIVQNPDEPPEGVRWLHCPLQKEQIDMEDIASSARHAFTDSLTEGYLNMVKKYGDLLAAALKEVTDSLERGAVLFHCSAGKDRTGVLASAICCLAGVDEADIIADYQVTFTYNRGGINRLLERMDEELREQMEPFMRSDPENMERLLALYRELDLPSWLGRYGFTAGDVERLKDAFLE